MYSDWQENSRLLLPAKKWEALLSAGEESNRELLLQVSLEVT